MEMGHSGVYGGDWWWPGAAEEPRREPAGERAVDFDWSVLRRLWDHLPEPAWTQERADRVFARVMATVERRRRRQRYALAATAIVALPCALIVMAHRR